MARLLISSLLLLLVLPVACGNARHGSLEAALASLGQPDQAQKVKQAYETSTHSTTKTDTTTTTAPPSDLRGALMSKFHLTGSICFNQASQHTPLRMPGQEMTIEGNAPSCQKRCKDVHGCAYFTFFELTKNCFLQNASAVIGYAATALAGPADPPGYDCDVFEAYLAMMASAPQGEPAIAVPIEPLPAGCEKYDPAMAKAMAIMAKLAMCGPGFGTRNAAVASCGPVCKQAGFELVQGRVALAKAKDKDAVSAHFGLVAQFHRAGNSSCVPVNGCIVSIHGNENREVQENPGRRLKVTEYVSPSCTEEIGCKVVSVVQEIWWETKTAVLEALDEAGCPAGVGSKVYLTGHSLGAGLATLAMFSLKDDFGYDVRPSYNFESPRIGNSNFATMFQKLLNFTVPLFRVTHGDDKVVRFPSADKGYVHVGSQVWYPGMDASNYTVCSSSAANCGIDTIPIDEVCPLSPRTCISYGGTHDCQKLHCRFPPYGGAHCDHPLAPSGSFCSFGGSTLDENTKGFTRSCSLGHALAAAPGDALANSRTMISTSDVEMQASGSKSACFTSDRAYSPLDMPGQVMTQEASDEACQARCSGVIGCKYFTYSLGLIGFPGSCHLAAETARVTDAVGSIVGPSTCSEQAKQVGMGPAVLADGCVKELPDTVCYNTPMFGCKPERGSICVTDPKSSSIKGVCTCGEGKCGYVSPDTLPGSPQLWVCMPSMANSTVQLYRDELKIEETSGRLLGSWRGNLALVLALGSGGLFALGVVMRSKAARGGAGSVREGLCQQECRHLRDDETGVE